MRGALERTGAVVELFRSYPSLEDAIGGLEERVEALALKLGEVVGACEFRAELLEMARVSQTAFVPGGYIESEHEGLAAVIEIVALAIVSSRDEDAELGSQADTRIPEIIELAKEILDVGSLLPTVRGLVAESPEERLGRQAVHSQLFIRNTTYPHIRKEWTERLWSESGAEEDCLRLAGFSPIATLEALEALQDLHSGAFNERVETIGRYFVTMSEQIEAGVPAEEIISNWPDRESLPPSAFDLTEVCADKTSVVTESFGFLSLRNDHSLTQSLFDLFDGRNPLRRTPLVSFGEQFALVHNGFNYDSVHSLVEETLKTDQSCWDRFAKYRGAFLEQEVTELISEIVPADRVLTGVEFFEPRDVDERQVSDFTRLVESDSLVIIDDVLLVVECKANTLSPRGRAGDETALVRDLRKIVSRAAEQADRVRERIYSDGGLRLRGDEWLDLSEIVEVRTIVVSLEDLFSIVSETTALTSAGLIDVDRLPWIISYGDLRIVGDLACHPGEFLIYLRRRTDPLTSAMYSAVDEIDYFMSFLGGDFYAEPDPEKRFAELPMYGEPRVSEIRRFKDQSPTFLFSQTDALDAWYFYQEGVSLIPAARPQRLRSAELDSLLNEIYRARGDGWLALSAALCDFAESSSDFYTSVVGDLAALSSRDGKPHSVTWLAGSRLDESLVAVFATPDPDMTLEENLEFLEDYIEAKRYRMQVFRSSALLFSLDGRLLGSRYVRGRAISGDSVLEEKASRLLGPGDFESRGKIRRRLRR